MFAPILTAAKQLLLYEAAAEKASEGDVGSLAGEVSYWLEILLKIACQGFFPLHNVG